MPKLSTLLVMVGINACWMISTFAGEVPLDVKTGLWEVKVSGQSKGTLPIPADELAKLPPEQRARFEQAMKNSMASMNHDRTFKECITEEQLKRGFKTANDDESCKQIIRSSTSTMMEVGEECTGKQKASATIRFRAISSKEVKGNIHVVAGHGADTMTIDNIIQAKWLGSDCGGLKPGDTEDE